MQRNNLQRKTKNKKKIQIARGGKRGKTAGRGTKGQKARAGHKIRPEIRDMIKKLPKMRGRGVNSNKSIQEKAFPINLSNLESFKAGSVVSPKTLADAGVIETTGNRLPKVKILGMGEVAVALTVKGCQVSTDARAKIEKAGGKIV